MQVNSLVSILTVEMPRSSARTRQRILEAAYRLFYRQGFLRSGVDAVAEAAGVTKRTLYNHFPSKDALIAAVLTERAGMAEAEMRAWSGTNRPDPETLVRGLFAGLRTWAAMPEWRGSGFTRAATAEKPPSTPNQPQSAYGRR